jgi:prepilin-type processing-associated H-X9-DG protein
MNCPKCGRQNHDYAQACIYCRSALSRDPDSRTDIDIKTSRLAVASSILAILGLPCFFIFGSREMQQFVPPLPLILAVVCYIATVSAVVLGIAALVCIEINYGRLTGRAFAAIGIAIPLVAFFLTTAYVTLNRPRSIAYRNYCGTNLSGIGKAMLIYSNDYDDEFPRAAGLKSKWGATPNYQADTRSAAFGLTNDANCQASISANFYLLVKYTEVTPKSFLCKEDRRTTEFIPAKYGVRNKELTDLWDFGPDPSKHCSYSYHIPYGPYPLTASSDPAMAVAADRNPWLPSPGAKPRNFKAFDPNGPREAIKAGNTIFHKEDGQNVLFLDGHAVFEKSSACGLNNDNIYTSWSGSDIKKGTPPTLKSQPADPTDSLLVHDPPTGDFK